LIYVKTRRAPLRQNARMIFRSQVRKPAAWLAAAAMLFAQLAVAAHACAASSGAPAAAVLAAHGDQDASPCHEMDSQPDSVCLQHCADSPQSFDHHPVSPVFPVAAPAYHLDRPDRPAVFLHSEERHSHALLARVTAPPLSVRNCCFRI
jgi:hypothetical protein